MERDVHVTLVLEVEKHECLYNTTLPQYGMKEEMEEAWSKVSENVQMPVSECKDKWRNIRSTFRRSFKPSRNAKPKRTYYLSRYLNFILPFTKPMDESIFHEDAMAQDDGPVEIKDENSEISEDEDEPSSSQAHSSWNEDDEAQANVELHSPDPQPSTARLRRLSSEDFSVPDHLKARSERTVVYHGEKEHMKYFFLSLLPEFRNMSEQQTRTFKIKVLQLIDDIKTERSQVPSSSRSWM
ncbi:uncharacterized protein [Epargyreus clarus]|uniref:uncharacterized protein n=1 Tax=Epargyreus clarus TaxID=520877 RepID=UPI003C2CA576